MTAAERLEEAWAWGLDPDLWRAHLGPATWPGEEGPSWTGQQANYCLVWLGVLVLCWGRGPSDSSVVEGDLVETTGQWEKGGKGRQ